MNFEYADTDFETYYEPDDYLHWAISRILIEGPVSDQIRKLRHVWPDQKADLDALLGDE